MAEVISALVMIHGLLSCGYTTQENHAIDWAKATAIDRESHCPTRWIKPAIHIRKEGQQAMNRDEGSDHFLDTMAEYQLSSDEGL